jgi:prepilin-type processing-associated H-X9-DG protein
MYNNDYDGMYDVGSGYCWFYPWDGGWAWDTQPYIKNLPVLRDPTDPLSTRDHYSWELPPNNPGVSISIVSNGFVWQNSPGDWSTKVGGLMGLDQSPQLTRCNAPGGGGWMTSGRTSETQNERPAETIMLALRAGSLNIWGMDDMISGVTWWDNGSGGAGLIPDGGAATTPYSVNDAAGVNYVVNKNRQLGAIYTPYANQSPFAFADGHVRTMNPVATNPNPNKTYINGPWPGFYPDGHDPKNMWDAYRP